MQKIIFLVLLSLSLCLSNPTLNESAGSPETKSHASLNQDATIPINTTDHQVTSTDTTNSVVAKVKPTELTNIAPNNSNQTKTLSSTQSVSNDTNKANDNNKTSDKKEETPIDNKNKSHVTPVTEKAGIPNPLKNETKLDEKKITETTITESVAPPKTSVTPTEAPKSVDPKPALQARGFDGPSFIGGIILAMGLLAIGFMGFKYYKNQTERNYHTL